MKRRLRNMLSRGFERPAPAGLREVHGVRPAHPAREVLEINVIERAFDPDTAQAQLEHEVNERRRVEEQLVRTQADLSLHNRIANAFLVLDGDEMFAEVLNILLEVLASRQGVFGYLDDDGALVCPTMTQGVFAECEMPNQSAVFPPAQWGGSIWGRAIREQRALCSNTSSTVPDGHIAMLRVISSPIVYQGKTIGLINVANKLEDYVEADVETLWDICQHLAPVLQARLQRVRHERERGQAEQALRDAHQVLEDRVAERTAELVATNQQLQREIAERVRTDQALREINNLLERIFATTQVLLAYIDPGFHYLRVNRAYAEYEGRAPEWFVGKNLFDLYPNPQNLAVFRRVMSTGEPASFQARPFTYEEHPGIGVAYWDWSLHSIKNQEGQVDGLLLCMVDVTQREQTERRARQQQSQLAYVSRLSTMGEMSTAIAHELNQPLCAIVTTAQASKRLLKAAGVQDGPVLEAIEQITLQAKRAGEMIRHLREFSRRRPTHRSTISMNEVIRDAVDFVSAEARPHRVEIEMHLADVPAVLGDTIQIEQVLVNLLRNGIEAMNDIEEAARRLEVRLEALPGNMIEVSIRDTGHGLPQGRAEQMFEPFFSTKPEGMGIGLTISRSIIDAHGGRLWAEPAANGGTVLRFVLPERGIEQQG